MQFNFKTILSGRQISFLFGRCLRATKIAWQRTRAYFLIKTVDSQEVDIASRDKLLPIAESFHSLTITYGITKPSDASLLIKVLIRWQTFLSLISPDKYATDP